MYRLSIKGWQFVDSNCSVAMLFNDVALYRFDYLES
jgi:hypothetical protein